ncbi:PKD domain-containing protein [Bowmanella denitrificans]|uniref:PKD domain-containing protein n=1 Tax=Bowmanella denitrificans TaxID=366582 RepID=UPI000C9CF105|nr:carboxypeptidase-like regulatory domain-containing protein [Bowmanella denitrificans]
MNTQLKVIATCIFISLSGCGGGGSDAPTVNVKPNQPPMAKFVASQNSIEVGELLSFDASSSKDPEQSALNYLWRIDDANGQALTLSDNSSKTIEFSPQQPGSYQVSLTVTDSQGATSSTKLVIEVTKSQRHTLSIKTAKTAKVGEKVALEAVFTHMLSEKVTPKYHWTLIAKPTASQASIQAPEQIQTYFLADEVGDYEIQLSMQLGNIIRRDVRQVISAHKAGNVPPQAIIDTRHITQLWKGDRLTLTSLSVDADNDSLSYQWLVKGGNVQAHPDNLESFEFEPLDLATYQVCLTVRDGKYHDTDCVDIQVIKENRAPVASFDLALGVDSRDLRPNNKIELLSDASDPDGDLLEYEWQVLSAPTGSQWTLDTKNGKAPVFQANMAGEYQLQLRVYDQKLYSEAFTKVISLTEVTLPQVQITSLETNISINQWVTLTANSNTAAEPVSYSWSLIKQPQGADGQLDGSHQRSVLFKADKEGEYLIQLVGTNPQGQSEPATIILTADSNLSPIARVAGQTKRNALVGDTVHFNAAISYDPEGQPLSYKWRVFEEANMQTVATQSGTEHFSFSPKYAGSYRVHLTVSDGVKKGEASYLIQAATELEEQLRLTGTLLDATNQPVSGINVATSYIKIRQGYTGFYETYTDESGQFILSFDRPQQGNWEPGLRVGAHLRYGYQDLALELDEGNSIELGTKKIATLQDVVFEARFCDSVSDKEYKTILRGHSDNTDFSVKAMALLSFSRALPKVQTKLLAPAIFASLNAHITFNGSRQFEHQPDASGTNTFYVDICEP